MAVIEKRKTSDGMINYRVKIRLKGYSVQHATFKNISKAKLWAQQTESAIREGRYFKIPEAKKHTMEDMIDRYIEHVLPLKPKSIKKQIMQLNWWKKELGYCLLSKITPALIAEKRDLLANGITKRKAKRSPSTVARYMAVLSHAFTVAVQDWNWIDDSPTRKVSKPKEPRGRVRFLEDVERTRLLKECKNSTSPYLFPIVILAISTGMRSSEIMNLTWKDVDLDNGRITLLQTKNGDIRVVPLVGFALDLLKDLYENRKEYTDLLFPGKNPQKPIKIRSPWESALERANIKDFRFHDLRHTAASYLAMNKATLTEIADILGHKTLSMVKRYSHLSESHTAQVVKEMNHHVWGGNKKELGALKALITDPTIIIEGKGKDAFEIKNFRHLIISSNEDWAIHMDFDGRRFFPLNVSDKRKEDIPYFKAIVDQMQNGGIQGLMYDLLNEDLKEFDPRKMPANDMGFDMKFKSCTSIEKYIYEALRYGALNISDSPYEWYWGDISSRHFYCNYRLWCTSEGLIKETNVDFGKGIRKLLPVRKRRLSISGQREWIYAMPSLGECRLAFQRHVKRSDEIWDEKD